MACSPNFIEQVPSYRPCIRTEEAEANQKAAINVSTGVSEPTHKAKRGGAKRMAHRGGWHAYTNKNQEEEHCFFFSSSSTPQEEKKKKRSHHHNKNNKLSNASFSSSIAVMNMGGISNTYVIANDNTHNGCGFSSRHKTATGDTPSLSTLMSAQSPPLASPYSSPSSSTASTASTASSNQCRHSSRLFRRRTNSLFPSAANKKELNTFSKNNIVAGLFVSILFILTFMSVSPITLTTRVSQCTGLSNSPLKKRMTNRRVPTIFSLPLHPLKGIVLSYAYGVPVVSSSSSSSSSSSEESVAAKDYYSLLEAHNDIISSNSNNNMQRRGTAPPPPPPVVAVSTNSTSTSTPTPASDSSVTGPSQTLLTMSSPINIIHQISDQQEEELPHGGEGGQDHQQRLLIAMLLRALREEEYEMSTREGGGGRGGGDRGSINKVFKSYRSQLREQATHHRTHHQHEEHQQERGGGHGTEEGRKQQTSKKTCVKMGNRDEFFSNFRRDQAERKRLEPLIMREEEEEAAAESDAHAHHRYGAPLRKNGGYASGTVEPSSSYSYSSSQGAGASPYVWMKTSVPLGQARSMAAVTFYDSKIIMAGGCRDVNCTAKSSLMESIDPSYDNTPRVTTIGNFPLKFEIEDIFNESAPPKIVQAEIAGPYSIVTVETITEKVTAQSRLWIVGACATYVQKPMMTYEDVALMNALHGGLWGLTRNMSAIETEFSLPPNLSLRANASCVSYLNRIFIVGGVDLSSPNPGGGSFEMLDTIDAYDIRNGTYYSSILKLKSQRMNAALTVDNVMLYVVGGQSRKTVFNNETNKNSTITVLSSETEAFQFSIYYLFDEGANFTRIELPQNKVLLHLAQGYSFDEAIAATQQAVTGDVKKRMHEMRSISADDNNNSITNFNIKNLKIRERTSVAVDDSTFLSPRDGEEKEGLELLSANPNLWLTARIFSFAGILAMTLGTSYISTLPCYGGSNAAQLASHPCLAEGGNTPSEWTVGNAVNMEGQLGAAVFAFPLTQGWLGTSLMLYAVGGIAQGSIMSDSIYFAFTLISASNPIDLKPAYTAGIITLTFGNIRSGHLRLSPNIGCYGSIVGDLYLNMSYAVDGRLNISFFALTKASSVYLCFSFGTTNIPVLNITNLSNGIRGTALASNSSPTSLQPPLQLQRDDLPQKGGGFGNSTIIGYQTLFGCLNALSPFKIVSPTTPAPTTTSTEPTTTSDVFPTTKEPTTSTTLTPQTTASEDKDKQDNGFLAWLRSGTHAIEFALMLLALAVVTGLCVFVFLYMRRKRRQERERLLRLSTSGVGGVGGQYGSGTSTQINVSGTGDIGGGGGNDKDVRKKRSEKDKKKDKKGGSGNSNSRFDAKDKKNNKNNNGAMSTDRSMTTTAMLDDPVEHGLMTDGGKFIFSGSDSIARNTTLDSRYRIVKRIGQGSFSSVYLVKRKIDGVMFAMKYLICENDRDRLEAIKECETINSIQGHHNIIALYDMFMNYEFGAANFVPYTATLQPRPSALSRLSNNNVATPVGASPTVNTANNNNNVNTTVDTKNTQQQQQQSPTTPYNAASPPTSPPNVTTTTLANGQQRSVHTRYLCLIMEFHPSGDLCNYLLKTATSRREDHRGRVREYESYWKVMGGRRPQQHNTNSTNGHTGVGGGSLNAHSPVGSPNSNASTSMISINRLSHDMRYLEGDQQQGGGGGPSSQGDESSLTPPSVPYYQPLNESALLSVAMQLCAALNHLHSCRPAPIVHRDLKPENVLIRGPLPTKEETFIPILITDFGLAFLQEENRRSGRGGGTRPYISPEAWRGQTTTASDMWSLGCVLYALATERLVAENVRIMFEDAKNPRFREEILRDLCDVHGYSLGLGQLILALLEVDPRRRPTSSQLLQRFEEIEITDERLDELLIPIQEELSRSSAGAEASASPTSGSPLYSPSEKGALSRIDDVGAKATTGTAKRDRQLRSALTPEYIAQRHKTVRIRPFVFPPQQGNPPHHQQPLSSSPSTTLQHQQSGNNAQHAQRPTAQPLTGQSQPQAGIATPTPTPATGQHTNPSPPTAALALGVHTAAVHVAATAGGHQRQKGNEGGEGTEGGGLECPLLPQREEM